MSETQTGNAAWLENTARIGLWLGPAITLLMFLLGAPKGMSAAGWHTLCLLVLMVVWWVSEALPVAVTALLPIFGLPLLGVMKGPEAAENYADPIIFLFIGGFILALALERWHLHQRLALNLIAAVGTRPIAVLASFSVASCALSMWISNTATALMLMPTALGVAATLEKSNEHDAASAARFGAALVLSVAYGASIGGIGTPIGSPTNLVAMAYLENQGLKLSFVQWMLMAVPMMLALMLVTWALLAWPMRHIKASTESREVVVQARDALGKMNSAERRVLMIFSLVAAAWIFRPLINEWPPLKSLTDTAIALIGALFLFIIPAGKHAPKEKLIDWHRAERLPWGVALLFGGGLTMAAAMESTGVSTWLGSALSGMGGLTPFVYILILVIVTIFASELASNTATLSAMLPVISALALVSGGSQLALAFAACIAASTAFMMPIGTPPNAIAYASGKVDFKQMARTGFWLNLMAIIVISVITYYLAPLVIP